jgi:hypothetical protein
VERDHSAPPPVEPLVPLVDVVPLVEPLVPLVDVVPLVEPLVPLVEPLVPLVEPVETSATTNTRRNGSTTRPSRSG